eukprot:TRINITY_DN4637_c0_g1_i1.p1 TRINITY_DN4637_c0_g1~~TRINITY_DN4637_c0_g1_i1.p1  ORF type:complete len:218 (-),score=67.96 TRINITY_DN4637_c0_g1_i1:25-594(-)
MLSNLDFVSPYHLYFNLDLILKGQYWRLLTNFLFFGHFGLDFFFHMYFLVQYSRKLEESSYRARPADFVFLLLFGATLLTLAGPFVDLVFLGHSLVFMLVYIWARRNQHVQMSFLNLFQFTAPYLPWVLLLMSVLLGSSPTVDLLGIAVGHVYFYLVDIYPLLSNRHLLKTPHFLTVLFPPQIQQMRGM